MSGRTSQIFGVVALLPLVGCASFEGMPKPIVPEASLVKRVEAFPIDAVFKQMDQPPFSTDKAQAKSFRNQVLSAYIGAADARYRTFRIAISKDMKGSSFGLDAAVLGLTSIGAVANGAANELSAASAALTGSRASLSKEVYMQQALPAILNSMESARLSIRAELIKGMKAPIDDYPLEQGFGDIVRYDMAGSMDGAIAKLNTEAGKAAAVEEDKYTKAVESCEPDTSTGAKWGKLNHYIYKLASDVGTKAGADQKLLDVMKVVDPQSTAAKPTDAASAKLLAGQIMATTRGGYCTVAALDALFVDITSKTGEAVQ